MFLHNDDVLKTITVISWKNKGRPDSIVFATAIPCFSDFLWYYSIWPVPLPKFR